MLRVYKFFGLMFIITICISIISCTQVNTADGAIDEISKSEQIKLLDTIKAPTGNEIKVEIKFFKPKEAIVTVQNISSDDVFLPYLPGLKDDWSLFACLGLEKKDLETEKFTAISCGDFAPGLYPLQAGKSFRYLLRVSKPGTYRVNVNYIIDEQLKNLINEETNQDKMLTNEEIVLKSKIITSLPIKL